MGIRGKVILANEIAFGLRGYLPALKRVAPQAQNFQDLGLDSDASDFAAKLLEMMNRANKIHFNLTGMVMLTEVLTGPKELNIPGSTNWELRAIWENETLLAKTVFYRDGKIISTAAVLK